MELCIGCIASNSDRSRNILRTLVDRYGLIEVKKTDANNKIDILIVLGGDGFMLHTIHMYRNTKVKIYGVNCGTLGFLMNAYDEGCDLLGRINNATETAIFPLHATIYTKYSKVHSVLAFNEVYVMRQTCQAAHIKISVNGEMRMRCMISDGVLLSTPSGSSAYNLSAGGAILPIDADLLSLTPICPFRPRRWRGAILPGGSTVEFEVLSFEKRSVHAVADFREYRNVSRVKLTQDRSVKVQLLFDSNHSLHERIIQEQFLI